MQSRPSISLSNLAAAGLGLALWLGLLLPSLERSRLQDVDELWHARTAQGAALEGHWWPLMLDGRPFYDKPPLLPWLAAVVATVSGQPRAAWPYRLCNTLGGALCLTCIIGLGALAGRFWGGLYAAALLGLQGDFVFHSRFFSMDTPWLGLSFLAAACAAWALSSGRREAWTLAGASLAVAFWCKSWFVLALAPAFGLAIWAAVPAGERAKILGRLSWPLGLAMVAWLALYTSWSGPGFLRQEWQGNLWGRLHPAAAPGAAAHLGFYLDWALRSAPAMLVLALPVTLGWGLTDLRQGPPSAVFVRVFAGTLAFSWLAGLALVPAETINYLLPLEAALALGLGLALFDPASLTRQRWLSIALLLAAWAMGRGTPAWTLWWAGGALGLALAWTHWWPAATAPKAGSLVAVALLLLALQVPDAVGLCTRPLDAHRHLAALLLASPPEKAGETLWAVQIPTRAVEFYSSYNVLHVQTLSQALPGEAVLYESADGALHLVPKHGLARSIKAL